MIVITEDRSAAAVDPAALALRDGAGCLATLLSQPTWAGCSVSALCGRARPGSIDDRTLRTLGLVLWPAPGSLFFAVAWAHPVLAQFFAGSDWIGGWSTALMTLPGAVRVPPMLFGRHYTVGILLPRSLLPGVAR